ncbi:LysR family transcriptional regulator [Vibrio diazotrophicus]|uniref:LysR substrate-binding domain-containing protein n=1 Tax=Vibrio diazotrophicus TaxID=685 RepID=UPI00142D425D|nr:LysR family transcriptional regulator [Vibrio diazotrophicus]NIY92129.1 LysR family transcriptional regulator [Vibrio diazotrophicus]
MKNLNILTIFCRVAEMANFTRAAEMLGIPKGRVSVVVRDLEKELGVALFHRTTRSVKLTEDGQAFYERAANLLVEAQELEMMFVTKESGLEGKLRVDMSTELARSVVIPALPQLLSSNPGLELELSCTDRRVDLAREGFDCAIRFGPVVDETLVAIPLGQLRMINAGSPDYLLKHGTPHTLNDLITQRHKMVYYSPVFGGEQVGWEYPDKDGYKLLDLPGAVQVNNVQAYHECGLAGIGLIQAGQPALKAQIEKGRLVEVLPNLRPEPLTASLVVSHRRNLSKRVRFFKTWLEGILDPYFV